MNFSEEISKLLKKKREEELSSGKSDEKGESKLETVKTVNESLPQPKTAVQTESVSLNSNAGLTSTEKRANLINAISDYKTEKERIEAIPDIVYEKKTYEPISSEELEKQASSVYDAEYDAKKSRLDSEKTAEIDAYNKEKQVASKSSNEQKRKINEYYDLAEDNLASNALKRGIQRSSIVLEQLKELGYSEIDDLVKADEVLRNELNDIDKKILSAEKDYSNAVKQLDYKKAVAISEELQKLKNDQDKKIKEIDEYNLKALEEVNKANSILNEQKAEQIKSSRVKALNEVLNYFYSLPRETRYQTFIEDKELQSLLDERDIDYIINYLKF